MAADLILALGRANLAAGLAILAVLLLRRPVRRLAGASVAYGLWLTPVLAGLCSLLPAPAGMTLAGWADPFGVAKAVSTANAPLAVLWLAGVVGSLALLTAAQARFTRRMARGEAGPALVGVLIPRIVMPRDFGDRFDADERRIIRAHEQAHLERQDARANALMALLQSLNWFNPLVHLAVRCARHDQELACDAAVIARYPRERRRYAQALLHTQLSAAAPPLGCNWPARAPHPLEERIGMLKSPGPSLHQQLAGIGAIAVVAVAVSWGAWASQTPAPKQDHFVYHDVRGVTFVEVSPEG
jgi:beta-lactamase regulating signal transducer with metallopeptidase domain